MVVQRRIVAVLGPELDMLESSSTSSMSGRYWKKKTPLISVNISGYFVFGSIKFYQCGRSAIYIVK